MVEINNYITFEGERIKCGTGLIMCDRIESAISNLNPTLLSQIREQTLGQTTALSGQNLIESNKKFYEMLIEGIRETKQMNTFHDTLWSKLISKKLTISHHYN